MRGHPLGSRMGCGSDWTVVIDRVAVMGFGGSGQRFASLLRQTLPDSKILVYSSRTLADGLFQYTTNLGDIKIFGPNIAIICGVASQRLQMIRALPDQIDGVLIEKPLAESYNAAIDTVHELARRGAVAQVGYNLRYSSSILEFKRRIDSLSLGKVLSVRAETGQYLPDWRNGRDYRNTASARQASGGGVLRELSHEVDYLRWIFGEIEWVSAWNGQQSGLEIDVEDSAHLTLLFSGSASATGVVGQLNLDFIRHDRTRRITAVCSEGSLRWDGVALRVEQCRRGSANWEAVFEEEALGLSTYHLQLESFCKAVEGGLAPDVTLVDGVAVLSVIDAARVSSEQRGIRVSPVREPPS